MLRAIRAKNHGDIYSLLATVREIFKRLLMIRKIGLVVSIAALSTSAIAAEAPAWNSNLEVGYVSTTGNTEVSSLNAKSKAIRDANVWRTTLEASALNVSDKVGTTAEKYGLSAQADKKIGESSYLFGRIGFKTNRFDGFKSRTSETVGYGFDILKGDEKQWNAEIGAGARQTELTTGEKTSDVVARASTLFNWKISGTATFSQELKTEGGKDGYVTNSVTSLLNQISGNFSSKISFSTEHTSEVPAGTEKMNTETAVSLVFAY